MIHRLLFIMICLSATDAMAAPASISQTWALFNRHQAVHQDDLAANNPDPRIAQLEKRIAEKIGEYGLREMTAREHGVTQNEYLARKARSQFNVIYFDVQARKNIFGQIVFDFIYAKGSDFFIEDEKNTVVEGCQAIERSGVLSINLERCLQAFSAASAPRSDLQGS